LATTLFLLPLIGALVIACIPAHRAVLTRIMGVGIGVGMAFLSMLMWRGFESKAGFQWVDDWPNLLGEFGVRLGVDGVSMPFIALGVGLALVALLFPSDEHRQAAKTTVIRVLLLLGGAMGVLLSLNLYVLCVSWALAVLVMARWVGAGTRSSTDSAGAAFLGLATVGLALLIGGVSLLLNQLGTETASLQELAALGHVGFPENGRTMFLLWAFAIAIFSAAAPFHGWLAESQAKVSVGGSVMLVGVLLPLGLAVFFRWGLALFPEALGELQSTLLLLAAAGVLYGAVVASVQTDPKRVLAHLTVSQMALIWMGFLLMRSASIEGAVLHTIQLGAAMGGLYFCVAWRESITQRQQVSPDGHQAAVPSVVRGFMLFFVLAVIGLPGTGGFLGEVLILATSFQEALSSPLEHTGSVMGLLGSWRIVVTMAASMASLGILIAALSLWRRFRLLVADEGAPHVSAVEGGGHSVRAWVVGILAVVVLSLGLAPNGLFEKVRPTAAAVVEEVGPRVIRARRERKKEATKDTNVATSALQRAQQ